MAEKEITIKINKELMWELIGAIGTVLASMGFGYNFHRLAINFNSKNETIYFSILLVVIMGMGTICGITNIIKNICKRYNLK